MGCPFNVPQDPSKRKFFVKLGLIAAAVPLATIAPWAKILGEDTDIAPMTEGNSNIEPFGGAHQNGIARSMQTNTSFATFDLTTTKREDVVKLLRAWTDAAQRMTNGQQVQSIGQETSSDDYGDSGKSSKSNESSDSDDTLGLSPSRLTITFGFGPGLFVKDGIDRYGLAHQRPEALIDMPRFIGDKIVAGFDRGDLSVQACADDPQVTFHVIRELSRLAYGSAELRWAQNGFVPKFGPMETPRNLMGFKDGTINPSMKDPQAMAKFIWVGDEGPAWMSGGTYMVVRKIRMALEHWDRMKLSFQEQTVGRYKLSGAPLSGKNEKDTLDLDAKDADGNPLIPENSHVALGAPANNDGAQILRRGYSYDNNLSFTAERWPPWHQGMEFDAGLLFMCYQRDPRTGFVKIYERMSKFDMLNQFVTHIGSGLFACPPGIKQGEFIGQRLFS
jgi:deferrochelatase/peroxidase EfeB